MCNANRSARIASTGEVKQSIPQVLLVEEDHDHKDYHEPATRQRL
jgi:hypothetical protein